MAIRKGTQETIDYLKRFKFTPRKRNLNEIVEIGDFDLTFPSFSSSDIIEYAVRCLFLRAHEKKNQKLVKIFYLIFIIYIVQSFYDN